MKTNRISITKVLLAVVPALLLAFVLQPAAALAATVTFQTDGHGAVEPVTQTLDTDDIKEGCISWTDDQERPTTAGYTPYVSTLGAISPKATPSDNYEIDYWEADVDVYLNFENHSDDRNYDFYVYRVTAGTHLTDEQMSRVYVDQNTTFTVYFKQKSGGSDTTPDDDPVTPVTPDTKTDTDDTTTVKPADNSAKKALPKTGNASTGAAALLCAGGAIVAGVAIARKRFC